MARILQQHSLEMPRPDKGSSSTYYATTKRARQDELRGGEKSALGFDNILRELAKLGHADQTSENHAATNETIIKCIREEDDRGRCCLKRHHTAASKSSASDKTRIKRDSGKNAPPQQDPRPPPKVQAESKDLSTTAHTSASSSHAEANLSSPPPPPKFSMTSRTPAGALAQPVAANADVQTHLVDRALSDGTSETATLHPSVATFSSITILDSADFNNDAEDMDVDRNSPVKSSRWTDLFVEKPLVVMEQFPAFSLPDVPPSSRQWTCDNELEDPDTLLPPAARLHQQSETNGEIAEQINSPFGIKHETLDFLSSKIDRSTTASHSHSLLLDSKGVDVQMDDSEDIDGEPVAADQPVQDQTENIDDAVGFRLRRPRRFTEQSEDTMLSLVSDEDCAPQFADDARAVIKRRRLKEENNARRDAAKSDISPDDVVSAIEKAIDAHIDPEAGSVLIVANSPTYNDTHNAGNVSPLQQATTNFATEPMLNGNDDVEPHFSAQSYVPTVSQIHEANETAEVPVFASAVEKAVDDAEPLRVRCSTYQYLSYPLLKFFRMMLGEMVEKAKRLPLREFYSQFISNPNISNKFNVQLTAENVERIIKRQCNKVVVISGEDDAVLFVKPNWYFAVFGWKRSAVLECEIEHDPAVFLKVQERLRTILTRSSNLTTERLFEKWKKGEIDGNGSIVAKNLSTMCAILHQYFTDTVEVSSDRSEPLNQAIVSLVRDAQFPSLCLPASSSDKDRRFTYLPFQYLRCFRNRIREEIRYRRDMRLREVVKRLHNSKVVQNLGVLTVANVERIIARQCRDVLKLTFDEAGSDEYHALGMVAGDDHVKLGNLYVRVVSFTSDPIPRSFMQKYQELDDELRQLFIEKMQVTLYNLLTSAPKQYLDLLNLCSAWNRCNSGGGNLAFVFETPEQLHDVLKYCFSDIVSLYSNSVQTGFRPDIVVALVLDAKFPARILTNNSSDDADDAGSRRSRSSSGSTEHRSRGCLVENDDDSYWRRMLTNGGERFRSDLVADLNDVFAEVEEKERRITLPLPKLYSLYKNNVTVSRRRRQPFRNAQQMGDIIKIYLADEFSVCFRPANSYCIGVDFVRRITH